MTLPRDPERSRRRLEEFHRRGQISSAESLRASSQRSARAAVREASLRPRSPLNGFSDPCWLAKFDPEHECSGLVVRCHLIKEQWLRDHLGMTVVERWHPDFWVPGCGGPTGIGGHHGRLDYGDIKLKRTDLPTKIERRAREDERIANKLELVFGPLPKIGAAA